MSSRSTFVLWQAERTLARGESGAVEAAWWPAGAAIEAHTHDVDTTLHVLSGEIVEERWLQSDDDGWRYDPRRLRAGERSTLAAGEVHRIGVRRSASVLVSSSRACEACVRPQPRLDALVRLSRTESAWSGPPVTTCVGWPAPAPEKMGDDDA
jgi:quercetin dioxygenase-like cupin family protein